MTNHACPSAEDVYNGVFGIVSRIDIEDGELVADFDGREITYRCQAQ
jgi:hypothetical protein